MNRIGTGYFFLSPSVVVEAALFLDQTDLFGVWPVSIRPPRLLTPEPLGVFVEQVTRRPGANLLCVIRLPPFLRTSST